MIYWSNASINFWPCNLPELAIIKILQKKIIFENSLWCKCQSMFKAVLHPLGPKSDQHQFSPDNVSRSSRAKVMRITKLISKGRIL